jgi:hypothetical protein
MMIAAVGDIVAICPAEAGEHPDQHAEHDADAHIENVDGIGENPEAVQQRRDRLKKHRRACLEARPEGRHQ